MRPPGRAEIRRALAQWQQLCRDPDRPPGEAEINSPREPGTAGEAKEDKKQLSLSEYITPGRAERGRS